MDRAEAVSVIRRLLLRILYRPSQLFKYNLDGIASPLMPSSIRVTVALIESLYGFSVGYIMFDLRPSVHDHRCD